MSKVSKVDVFDVCGISGERPINCFCMSCQAFRMNVPVFDDDWFATTLNVPYDQKEQAKIYGCRWSQTLRKWYVRANNKDYKEIVEEYK